MTVAVATTITAMTMMIDRRLSQVRTTETVAGQNKGEAVETRKPGGRKVWLWLLPLLGFCALWFCLLGGGLILWQVRANRVGGSEAALQPAASLSTAGPTLVPTASPPGPTSLPAAPSPAPVQTEPVPPLGCPTQPLPESPVVDGPLLSAISFATRQDGDGWPLDTALQFTTAVTKVQASFGYYGLRNGLAWERVWYFGDEAISRAQGVWDAGSEGELTVHVVAGEGGFAPGRYRLEISVAGELLNQGEFVIVAEDTPTERPVQVAYTTWDGTRTQLNLLDLRTGETRPLLDFARGPAWSPDATGLLFYAEDGFAGGPPGLWVFNLGLQKPFPLTEETFFRSIAWSPQRTYVASSMAGEQGPRLVLWDLFDQEAHLGPPGEDPAWSPDGRRLAYRSCDEDGWHLNTVHVVGHVFDPGTVRRLTHGDDGQPAWSPDGQRLAFTRREGDNQDIYTVAPDGSDLRRLTDHPAIDTTPTWTPDQRLVFRSRRGGEWGLYVMNADGSDQRRLITTPSPPDWQPDRLAVSSDVLLVEPAPPKPPVQIPAGHGLLVISNQKNNDEMTFTIAGQEHKIGPFQIRTLPLRPGHYTWTASWPGKNSRSGVADIVAGQVAYPVVER